jgi:hypothetical protein
MPGAHPSALTEPELRRAPASAAYKKLVRCLSRPWCGIRKKCNRSSRLSERCARESAECTRTEPPYRKTGIVCSNAIRNCTSDTCPADRIPPQEPLRNSSNALASQSRPYAACEGRGGRSRRAGRLVAVYDPCLSFRAVLAFPRRDSRGVHTCDPQTPPSASRTRTVTTNFHTTEFKISLFPRYPIG